MNHVMKKTQIFCLKNWAVCSNSLHMQLTASFEDGHTNEISLDLSDGTSAMDGLLIDIDPMADGVGILYLGIDPTDCEKIVKRFTLKLESDRGTIQQLHLEYAFSDSLDAYQKKIHWEDVPLFQECLTFTVKDDEISVDMTNSGVAEITNELAETPNDVRFTWEDLQGDIEADLQILCYYNSTETREIIRNLEKLLYGLQEIPLKHALSSLQEQERKLTHCITRTQEDVQKYQDAFLEKS